MFKERVNAYRQIRYIPVVDVAKLVRGALKSSLP